MDNMNRRDFIRNIFRLGVAGGLVALGIKLSSESSKTEILSGTCTESIHCRQCNQSARCTLPKALAELKNVDTKADTLVAGK